MSINNIDKRYMKLVNEILTDTDFNKTKELVHHGQNRYDHLLRVSYLSYKITKMLGLDYKSTARGGLLHDFFFERVDVSTKERRKLLTKHPEYALNNSIKKFDLNDKEKDIILNHMFPITFSPPKYAEAWIVDAIDNAVAVYERGKNIGKHVVTAANVMLILFFSAIK